MAINPLGDHPPPIQLVFQWMRRKHRLTVGEEEEVYRRLALKQHLRREHERLLHGEEPQPDQE